jgi:hypothetical protein
MMTSTTINSMSVKPRTVVAGRWNLSIMNFAVDKAR